MVVFAGSVSGNKVSLSIATLPVGITRGVTLRSIDRVTLPAAQQTIEITTAVPGLTFTGVTFNSGDTDGLTYSFDESYVMITQQSTPSSGNTEPVEYTLNMDYKGTAFSIDPILDRAGTGGTPIINAY